MRRSAIPTIFAILLTGACSKGGPTLASGDIALVIDSQASANLSLPSATTLAPVAGAASDGHVVGQCVLGGATVDVSIERTASGDAGVSGLAWFRLHLDSPEAPQLAHVFADVEGELYEADCDVAAFARSRDEGMLDLAITACELMTPTPSGGSAILDVELAFSGCTTR